MTLRPVCLAGPTASGKSALAMAFAEALRGEVEVEIISVDSAQIYRGMDIGTAKPSADERARVPHHLIDIIDPEEAYSAARFAADARRLAAEISARGRLPLLVGGTMLYFKALREGLHALPPADAALRRDIDARAAQLGRPALHDELRRVDAATAARLAPNDAQRIQRALEVWQLSGKPLSAWHAAQPRRGAESSWPLIALEPASRAWLHQRIARRFDAMLEAGLVDEVRRLRERAGLHASRPSMRCVGYRQAWAALESGKLSGLRDTGIAATRQLAKRQLTWLRSMPERSVVVCDSADVHEAALHALQNALTRVAGCADREPNPPRARQSDDHSRKPAA